MPKDKIPDYIRERIIQSPPRGVRVVPNSTPVVAFGDSRKARVATLTWNPSKFEFLSQKGDLLVDNERRLETQKSLTSGGIPLGSPQAVARILEGCNHYFHRRPYRWFGALEKILKYIGASYYDGSACHLDLVQWATDPVWSDLQPNEQDALLRADVPFLRRELAQEGINLLLLNGAGIVKAYEGILGGRVDELEVPNGGRVRMFFGRANAHLTVVGWNINLQSSFGVSNDEIASIGRRANQIASQLTSGVLD